VPKLIEDARGRILAAVRGNVRKEGWEALAIRRIAERAGMAQGTIYNYFSCREEIAHAALEQDWEGFRRAAELRRESGPRSGEELALLFASLREFMALWRRLWDEGLSAALALGQHYHLKSLRVFEEDVAAFVERALAGRKAAPGLDRRAALDLVSLAFVHRSRVRGFAYESLSPIIDRLFEAD